MFLSKLIPYEKITIQTNLSSDEIIRRIKNNTTNYDLGKIGLVNPISETIKLMHLLKHPDKNEFIGKVEDKEFEIMKNPYMNFLRANRNSFRPIINGQVENNTIIAKITLHPIIIAFVSIFLFILLNIIFFLATFKVYTEDPSIFLFFIATFIIFYIMMILSFRIGLKKIKNSLLKVVEGHISR